MYIGWYSFLYPHSCVCIPISSYLYYILIPIYSQSYVLIPISISSYLYRIFIPILSFLCSHSYIAHSLQDQVSKRVTTRFKLKDISYCAKHPDNEKLVIKSPAYSPSNFHGNRFPQVIWRNSSCQSEQYRETCLLCI